MKPVLKMHEGCLKYEGGKYSRFKMVTNSFVIIQHLCDSIDGLAVWDKYDWCIDEDC